MIELPHGITKFGNISINSYFIDNQKLELESPAFTGVSSNLWKSYKCCYVGSQKYDVRNMTQKYEAKI